MIELFLLLCFLSLAGVSILLVENVPILRKAALSCVIRMTGNQEKGGRKDNGKTTE